MSVEPDGMSVDDGDDIQGQELTVRWAAELAANGERIVTGILINALRYLDTEQMHELGRQIAMRSDATFTPKGRNGLTCTNENCEACRDGICTDRNIGICEGRS